MKLDAARKIIQDARKNWIAEDGLMRLNLDDDRDPYPDARLRTVQNQNGIMLRDLFEIFVARTEADPTMRVDINLTLTRLERQLEDGTYLPGNYNRHEGDNHEPNSLDNFAAIADLSLRFETHHAGNMCDYGEENGIWDNVDPLHTSYNLSRWRQGSDICHYKMCSTENGKTNRIPYIHELIWFWGGIIWNSFQRCYQDENGDHFNTSDHIMTFIRLESFDLVRRRKYYKKHPKWVFLITKILHWFWNWRLHNKTGGGIEVVLSWFLADPKHPIRLLSQKG